MWWSKVIKKLRKEKGLTLADMEKLTGFHQPYLSSLENGKHSPKISTLESILKELDQELTIQPLDEHRTRS
tara:strand:+ start:108 stop:320 length:213 start_codon:yes stop_codon:yes gene_type:complete